MPSYSRYVSIGAESSYGVAVTPTTRLDIAAESLELRKAVRLIDAERLISHERTVSPRRFVQGSVDAFLGFEKAGSVLKAVLASPTSTSLGSGAYSHVYKPSASSLPPSQTIDVPREIQTHRYTGCVFSGLRLSLNGPEYWGLSLGVLGKDEDLAAIGAVNDSDFEDLFWTIDPAAADPFDVQVSDGVTTWDAPVSALDLELAYSRSLRFPERAEVAEGFIDRGVVKARGQLRWIYGTDTSFLYTAFRAEADVSVTVTWTGASIGGGNSRQIRFAFPVTRLLGRTPTVRGPGYGNIDHELPFEALYSSANAAPVVVTLINTSASY